MKKISGIEAAFLTMGILWFISFIGFSLALYEVRLNANENRTYVTNSNNDINELREATFNFLSVQERNIEQIVQQQEKLKSQIGVLEASLDSQEIRWARIKKVRDTIKVVSTRSLLIEELTDIASAVVDRADEYDVPASLVLAIIRQESNFNKKAISSANAKGLMQVMPFTANDIRSWLGVKYYNWSKPSHNIRFGTLYLARMLHNFEDNIDLAISAYNCGPTCVENVRSQKWKAYPEETQNYLIKVKEWKKEFEDQGITW